MVVMLLSAINAAAVAPLPVSTGWTWTATMGLVQNLILLGGGGGIGVAIIRAGVQLKKIGTERAGKEDDRESNRWREMMDFNSTLTARVEKLELDLREERRRCDEDLALTRKLHLEENATMRREAASEIRSLNEKIDGLQRMLLQNQISVGNMLDLSDRAPKASDRLGQTIKTVFPVPGDDL